MLAIDKTVFAFGVVGTAGFLADASIVAGLAALGVGPITAQCVAFFVAVHVTWLGNRSWTFRGQGTRKTLLQEWLLYTSANGLGWLVNNCVYISLILSMPLVAKHPVWAVAVGSIAGLFFNYAAAKRVVFL